MAKTNLSVRIEMHDYVIVRDIAGKCFDGNMGKTVEWIIRSVSNKEKFYRFMAQLHASQMQHFKELADQSSYNPPQNVQTFIKEIPQDRGIEE